MNKVVTARRPRAFTLVELLVVIGIIAILISTLLPVLGSARKAADKAKCLASLQQMGNAFKLYQVDNKGAWPVAAHFWNENGTNRDKRYHDFIAKYVMGNQQVTKPGGQKITSNEMNFNGTCSNDTLNTGGSTYATHGAFGTDTDPIWIGTLRDRNSILWGCPVWSKVGTGGSQYDYASNNGYSMNIFPMSPLDLAPAATSGVDMTKTARVIGPGSNAGGEWKGKYYKMTSWKAPGDRALLFDGVHNGGYFSRKSWNEGTAVTEQGVTFDPTKPGDLLPKFTHFEFALDWNRHTKGKPGQVRNSDPALNMLFCDGHAATVSTREAYKAIRFK
jgi:prepilin-type N-terminal cleavage/methylation domain-containing protein/prepilin-type processing-associated H-X9-DG protein